MFASAFSVDRSDWIALYEALGHLRAPPVHASLAWREILTSLGGTAVGLLTYPFQRQRYCYWKRATR